MTDVFCPGFPLYLIGSGSREQSFDESAATQVSAGRPVWSASNGHGGGELYPTCHTFPIPGRVLKRSHGL